MKIGRIIENIGMLVLLIIIIMNLDFIFMMMYGLILIGVIGVIVFSPILFVLLILHG